MSWTILFHDAFEGEFEEFPLEAKEELLAKTRLLREFGPTLGRPHADTLKGSSHANMKELRFKAADGVWRIAFAFDPKRRAIILVGGDKAGVKETRFYKSLIARADERLSNHLKKMQEE